MNQAFEQIDRQAHRAAALDIIDNDIHPAVRSPDALAPFLPRNLRETVYDMLLYGPHASSNRYPRFQPATSRRDAWPPNGGPPGSDLDFMREQHLDKNGISLGILEPLMAAYASRNLDVASAFASALNDWQLAEFVSREPRLRASITVSEETPALAVHEIDKRAAEGNSLRIQLPGSTLEPIGRQRYWALFEAAEHFSIPIGMHIGGQASSASTASGWPSYYNEDHYVLVHGPQTQVTSMILEGVFERFPRLKLVLVETGLAWEPPLSWRLDSLWRKIGKEVPRCKLPPSEYLKRHVYFTTQPMEEPERSEDLIAIFETVGWDRILFSSDYPHWDFDDPKYAFKASLTQDQRLRILTGNSKTLYAQ